MKRPGWLARAVFVFTAEVRVSVLRSTRSQGFAVGIVRR